MHESPLTYQRSSWCLFERKFVRENQRVRAREGEGKREGGRERERERACV
jgi:hypothetical protein